MRKGTVCATFRLQKWSVGQDIAILVCETLQIAKMVRPYQGLGSAPYFQVGITKSKLRITEINLFFPEPPGQARSFGTLRPILFQKFVVPELKAFTRTLK